jgi:hypothetical protein
MVANPMLGEDIQEFKDSNFIINFISPKGAPFGKANILFEYAFHDHQTVPPPNFFNPICSSSQTAS